MPLESPSQSEESLMIYDDDINGYDRHIGVEKGGRKDQEELPPFIINCE